MSLKNSCYNNHKKNDFSHVCTFWWLVRCFLWGKHYHNIHMGLPSLTSGYFPVCFKMKTLFKLISQWSLENSLSSVCIFWWVKSLLIQWKWLLQVEYGIFHLIENSLFSWCNVHFIKNHEQLFLLYPSLKLNVTLKMCKYFFRRLKLSWYKSK